MLFNSYLFLFLFFPLVLVLYYNSHRLPFRRTGTVLLLLSSCLFIVFAGWYHMAILAVSVLINFCILRTLSRTQNRKKRTRSLLLGLFFNIGFLAVFKYANSLLDKLAGSPVTAQIIPDIVFPLGVSFYTFQQIAFLIDDYRGEQEEDVTFLDYATFVTFFPKLLEGPILNHNELLPSLRSLDTRYHPDNFARGLYLFSMGLAKKVLIADNFGKIVDYGFSHIHSLNSLEALLTILGYSFQIYFDFSGYCDMALGAAKMLNIDLPWNFDSPYKARNISDFWKRWHITLTRFLTKHIYYPLGGNRRGILRTYCNIMIVFLVSGLWHGTGVTFLIWGAMHGAASVLFRLFRKPYETLPKAVQWLLTFVFVTVAWVFFRAASLSEATSLLSQVVTGGWHFSINAELTETLLQPAIINLLSQLLPFEIVIAACYCVSILLVLFTRNTGVRTLAFQPTLSSLVFSFCLLLLSIMSISGVSTFLYVNF